MKSIVYNSKSVSGITQIQYCISPELKHSQLIVQVKSVSLNPVDAKFIIFDKLPKFTHNYLTPLIDNRIVGFDFAGVVSSSKSIHYKPGDRVFGITSSGSLSNEIIVPDSQVSLMPSTSTFSEAAALPLVNLTITQAFKNRCLNSILVYFIYIGYWRFRRNRSISNSNRKE